MSKAVKSSARKRTAKPVVSGATGGPATTAGLIYQVNVTVGRILRLCMDLASSPVANPSVQLEARALSGSGDATRWDLGFALTGELAEIKLNPGKQDLSEWIIRARRQAESANATQFLFIYGSLRGRRLVSLKHLIRIAVEAGTDQAKFDELVELEDIPETQGLLQELGPEARALLLQMKLVELGESSLSNEIDLFCKELVGPAKSREFRDFLFARVIDGIPHRGTIHVRELVEELVATREIQLIPMPRIIMQGLDREVRDALLLLSICPSPLPEAVLASAVGVSAWALKESLSSANVRRCVALENDKWRLLPSPTQIPKADAVLSGQALRALLIFISEHKYQLAGREQVRNALTLAQACMHEDPREVARMFIYLDKPLKGIGDKFLVLRAAEMAISAAKRANPRDKPEAQGEAHAMICGKSWALQRTGHLSEALIVARDSRDLGCAIQWDRNTAYCEKCIGRLYRLQAEQTNDTEQKATLIKESVAHLQEAIRLFSELSDFGPEHPEVGDCYSLLGRTWFAAGNEKEALQAVQKADELIIEQRSKDYLDLLILRGELAERSNREKAEALYSEVLQQEANGDSERSEIVARAYLQRGIIRAAMGKKPEARTDLTAAKRLWDRLEETGNSARAEWELFKLDGAVTPNAASVLSGVPLPVRVEAIRIHQERLKDYTGPKVARRAEPGTEYWKKLLPEASTKAAVKSQKW
jgi:tetratricopeptide (TPR) repeat protein